MSNPNGQAGPIPPKPALGAGVRPGLSLEAIEKAKKALQLQKEIQEKLRNKLPQLQARLAAKAEGSVTSAGGAPANPLIALAAKKAAEIASRLGSAPLVQAPAAPVQTAADTAVVPGSAPRPLRVNAQGQEVDEHGRVIQQNIMPVATLRINQAHRLLASVPGLSADVAAAAAASIAQAVPPASAATMAAAEPEEDPFFDPRIGTRGAKKLERRRKMGLEFVAEGKFQKEAELMRLKAQYGAKWGGSGARRPMAGPQMAGGHINSNLVPIGPGGAVNSNLGAVPIGKRVAEEELSLVDDTTKEAAEGAAILSALGPQPPEVEWWDKLVLQHASYAAPAAEDGGAPPPENAPIPVKESKITIYVEHPVLLEPPAEPPMPPPQPLKLTSKEIKKLRTQRRLAREREKQELVRQGLLEPAKPKVKLSNLHRVLATDATLDPTAVDMEVRRQMAERQAAHEDRNLARMLTPAERRAKKIRKLFDEESNEVICSVYRVAIMESPVHRFKVEINAKENHMSGLLTCVRDGFGVAVVEGCPKATKRYAKLMLRRIDWNARRPTENEDEMEEEEEEPSTDNRCDLVWQGQVKSRIFRGFKVEKDISLEDAAALFRESGASQYWDAAASFNPQEAPIMHLD